jgi:hypothetical protein
MKHKTMLFRSGIILFYFSEWAYHIVNEIVVKGTPRVGHPAIEGLRLNLLCPMQQRAPPRVGHPAKEGLRQLFFVLP